MTNKRFKITFDQLPPSNNDYLKPKVETNAKNTYATFRETKQSKEFKRFFREALTRESIKQNWNIQDTIEGDWYLEIIFTMTRKDQDTHNRLKVLIDSLTGVIINDDKNVLPRIHRIYYDPKNPSFTLVLHRVDYVGLFKNQEYADKFEDNCKSCRYYRDGGCAILKKIKEARKTPEYDDIDNSCDKYIEKKRK